MRFKTDLMLVPQVVLQLLPVLGVVVAELALVRLQLIVFVDVLLQTLVTRACERALVAAEHQTLQVTRQFRARDLQGHHSLLCRVEKGRHRRG